MNERIRELAKQAGFIDEDGGDNLHVFDGYEAITCTEELKKFAELIVQECRPWLSDDAFEEVKEHFGVE